MTTLYLLRHGQSQHNLAFEQGNSFESVNSLGSHLTDLGHQQAREAAQNLAAVPLSAIFSSDYHRAQETAQAFSTLHQLPVTLLPELRERTWGSLEGKHYGPVLEEIKKRQMGLSDKEKMQIKLTPDMESEWECAQRMETVLSHLANQHSGETVLIVSHGNTLRSLLVSLGFEKYDQFGSGSIPNCGYFVLNYQDGNWERFEK
jgi:broad specificity phosphatase PhoE